MKSIAEIVALLDARCEFHRNRCDLGIHISYKDMESWIAELKNHVPRGWRRFCGGCGVPIWDLDTHDCAPGQTHIARGLADELKNEP